MKYALREAAIEKTCEECGELFKAKPNKIRRGFGRFCGRACAAKFRSANERYPSLSQAFWSRVDKSGSCWEWIGARYPQGYGLFTYRGRTRRATHVSWEIATGETFDPLLDALHTCDTPSCVRNDDIGIYEVNGVERPRVGHIFSGTQADNSADMVAKGRSASGARNARHSDPERRRGERNGRAKLTSHQVQEIRTRYAEGGVGQKQLAHEYSVNQPHISRIIRGTCW